jgi:predicted HD phosphohydrolase
MEVAMDRRKFLAAVGGIGVVELLSHNQRAEALEAFMIQELNRDSKRPRMGSNTDEDDLPPMPEKPTLVDFYRLRFAPARHVLQSAARAVETGMPERTILACLMHDLSVSNLMRPDHGYWCAQMIEPYVDERISWGIRYHQALRFFPDPAVGYEYPEMYNRMFGRDYEPDEYIKQAHQFAKGHKWYMEARSITMNDEYSFDPNKPVSLDPFIDVIGRHFKTPPEGLGYDNSPVAHMWRSMANPKRPL